MTTPLTLVQDAQLIGTRKMKPAKLGNYGRAFFMSVTLWRNPLIYNIDPDSGMLRVNSVTAILYSHVRFTEYC